MVCTFCKETGFQMVILEGDAKIVVDAKVVQGRESRLGMDM
jgi:hypothetical protein